MRHTIVGVIALGTIVVLTVAGCGSAGPMRTPVEATPSARSSPSPRIGVTDPSPSGQPETDDRDYVHYISDLVTFSNPQDGYTLPVPGIWGDGEVLQPGVHAFGSGVGFGTRNAPALTISVGSADGTIPICDAGCRLVEVATLDEIATELVSAPRSIAERVHLMESTGELMLGGQPGRFERPSFRISDGPGSEWGIGRMGGGNCLGCPGMRYHAYAFLEGRPVVLAIDWWTIAFGKISPSVVVEMIKSFRLDADATPTVAPASRVDPQRANRPRRPS